MSYFYGKDLDLIESLVYNPDLQPCYDFMRDCLIWFDERPNGLSSEGYEKLGDLWIIRSFIHQKMTPSNWGLNPEFFQESWLVATKQNFRWPGFFRLQLNQSNEEYYKRQRDKAYGDYLI